MHGEAEAAPDAIATYRHGPVASGSLIGGLRDAAFPVPSDQLRWRATGKRAPELEFRQEGRASLEDFQRALRLLNRSLVDFERVLDFGCGCGRVLRHMAHLASRITLHGCDIDAEAIEWARRELPFVNVLRNTALPPLDYEDGYFDLVVNHSVFTHLPENYQDAWLAELRRIVQPDGYLILSVSGPHAFSVLVQSWRDWPADPAPLEQIMRERGFLYTAEDEWRDTCFPDWYHSTFHSPSYVIDHWGEYFTVLGYLPRAALNFQDLVLLRRD